VPVSPMGKCVFLNDVSHEEMCEALEAHKQMMKRFPRQGEGLEAYVDASDAGYIVYGVPVEMAEESPDSEDSEVKTDDESGLNNRTNGSVELNGLENGLKDALAGRDGRIAVVPVSSGTNSP
jgi:3-dehydroquinate synthase